EVDLTQIPPTEFFRNDLIRYRLTGTLPSGPDFSVVNFIACELYDIRADGIDFSECDFKDTLVKGANFSGCKFDGGTFATTFFAETEFRSCTFYNHAAYSCDFRQVRFNSCDLTNLLIKSSRFSECAFQNCVTSNKICEMSTVFDVNFDSTPIQLETITSNFGLRSNNLTNSMIRSGRARETHQSLSADDLNALLNSAELSALEGLALEYFLEESLINGSRLLDESLDITRWTRIHRNPGSFVELLDKFGEFLIHLYDDNRLTLHPILLLHHVTSTLTASISSGSERHRVAMSLGGLHLILSRIVEDYLQLLQLISDRTPNSLTFLAEGPLEPEYFRKELEPWIGTGEVKISRLERNSPLLIQFIADHSLSLVPLLGVFLATRTNLEITRLKSNIGELEKTSLKDQPSKRVKAKRNLPARRQEPKLPLLSLSTGMVEAPNPAYELRVRSLLGSILVDLRLNFSTTLVRRLRGILLDLLTDSSSKRS
ncbi:MAG TPA: pentapeptide repeat-containing protein, partial [Ktedonobacteraceae bacterium]|nr:pentapeptide repeat-containing protein [Ktedonobacteraceae bacterium]